MKIAILISLLFVSVSTGGNFISFNETNRVPYIDDLSSGYARRDYQWILSNTGQESLAYQNGLSFPSLNEPGGTADAGILKAWTKQPNANGIIISVIDTGVNTNTYELSGKVIAGVSINDRPPAYYNEGQHSDFGNHGTSVASVIAARPGRMTGVAPGVRLLAVATPLAFPSYVSGHIAKGIIWSVDHGADICVLAYGESGPATPELYAAMVYAQANDVAIVSAVSEANQNLDNNPSWPYAYNFPNYVAVAGTTRTGARYAPSSYGSRCVGAPARVVVQLDSSGNCGYSSGTSFAAPIVAGLLALMEAYDPGESMATHITRMKDNAANYPTPGIIGRVNGDQLDK